MTKLKDLIAETKHAVEEAALRWPGGVGLDATNVKGVVTILSKQLKGMGYSYIVRMLDQKKWKDAQKELSTLISDAERQGKSTIELRRMYDAIKKIGGQV